MSHFARITAQGIVEKVIVAEQEFIDNLPDKTSWVQTSYNTYGGVHYDPKTQKPSDDQSKALRKNYAGIGSIYDAKKDAFMSPQPYDSWTLNEFSFLWEPPVAYPTDGKVYTWNESIANWEEVTL